MNVPIDAIAQAHSVDQGTAAASAEVSLWPREGMAQPAQKEEECCKTGCCEGGTPQQRRVEREVVIVSSDDEDEAAGIRACKGSADDQAVVDAGGSQREEEAHSTSTDTSDSESTPGDGFRYINGAKYKLEYCGSASTSHADGYRNDSDVRPVPVFYATASDVLDAPFEAYIERIEDVIQEYGACKIVPPEEWSPTSSARVLHDRANALVIPKPIRQHVNGRAGVFRTMLLEQKAMRVGDTFMPHATSKDNQLRFGLDELSEIERSFWRNLAFKPPLYGADIEGSLFDADCKGWKVPALDTMLSKALLGQGIRTIPGVISPYLYFGMWRSLFCWHTEDVDLYSIK